MENITEHIPPFNASTAVEWKNNTSESQPVGRGSSGANLKRKGQSVSEPKAKGTKQRRRTYRPMKNLMPLKMRKQSTLGKLIEEMKKIDREVKASNSEEMKAIMEPRLVETGKEVEGFVKIYKEFKRLRRLADTGDMIQRLHKQVRKDTTSCVLNLAEISKNEGFTDVEALIREKLSSVFPGEIATNGPTADQDHGICQDQGFLQPYLDKILAEDNKLDVSYFQKEIENPDSLEHYVSRFRMERGKDTESELLDFQPLLCAASKQMDHVRAREVTWDMLLKWGAVLNKAKALGFRLKFVEYAFLKCLSCYYVFKCGAHRREI